MHFRRLKPLTIDVITKVNLCNQFKFIIIMKSHLETIVILKNINQEIFIGQLARLYIIFNIV